MGNDVETLAVALGDIRVAGAREADWWISDEDHHLLIQVLRAECTPWAEGLLASDWLAARDQKLRESIAVVLDSHAATSGAHISGDDDLETAMASKTYTHAASIARGVTP